MFGAAPLTLGFHKDKESGAEVKGGDGRRCLRRTGWPCIAYHERGSTYMQTSCYVIVCEDAVGTLKKKRTGKGTPYSMIIKLSAKEQ